LARYLRDQRPASRRAHVFLRAVPPHLRLSPNSITTVVAQIMRRGGLSHRGPHTLRHAFATRLLRHGHSLKVIADLLGHRSLEAVSVYAKVDYGRLREVASEWPEVHS
jgi:site-specific recombinase XerD